MPLRSLNGKIDNEPIINKLGQAVHYAVRALAVLMTLVILWGVIDVQIVIATALMAISRKIIVLDFKEVDAEYVWASAAVIIALGVTYWLIAFKQKEALTDS
ncbi:hypothetical protein FM037_06630 [Shewanella psychropiezotolerans]|uniref:Uncharacterized protein n=2 Tax=Shewanellaceae TaxID=267890 RepID=A0ABX5WYZ8_9GAMM|nr:hypothetical protein [Shewanella sp. YLB-07]QDO82963.1 hypothetical protein FM037_06630 [Shewanella psychropiezotolerans]